MSKTRSIFCVLQSNSSEAVQWVTPVLWHSSYVMLENDSLTFPPEINMHLSFSAWKHLHEACLKWKVSVCCISLETRIPEVTRKERNMLSAGTFSDLPAGPSMLWETQQHLLCQNLVCSFSFQVFPTEKCRPFSGCSVHPNTGLMHWGVLPDLLVP